MNRSSEIKDFFEVIATYLVNVSINTFYDHAATMVERNIVDNQTDAYRHVARKYVENLNDNPKVFTETMKDLHKTFMEYSKYRTLEFVDWTKRLMACFVPLGYCDSISSVERSKILNRVIKDSFTSFVISIIEISNLRRIIDCRVEPGAARYFQDMMIDRLEQARTRLFSKFLTAASGNKSVETVPTKHFNHLKKKYFEILKENQELKRQLEILSVTTKHSSDDSHTSRRTSTMSSKDSISSGKDNTIFARDYTNSGKDNTNSGKDNTIFAMDYITNDSTAQSVRSEPLIDFEEEDNTSHFSLLDD